MLLFLCDALFMLTYLYLDNYWIIFIYPTCGVYSSLLKATELYLSVRQPMLQRPIGRGPRSKKESQEN